MDREKRLNFSFVNELLVSSKYIEQCRKDYTRSVLINFKFVLKKGFFIE